MANIREHVDTILTGIVQSGNAERLASARSVLIPEASKVIVPSDNGARQLWDALCEWAKVSNGAVLPREHITSVIDETGEAMLVGEFYDLLSDREPVPDPVFALALKAINDRISKAIEETDARILRVESFANIKLRSTFWTWDGRLPVGTLSLLAGREDIGKSLITCWLAARVTRGELPGIHFGQPKSVIIVATEDSASRQIGPRLVAAGVDLNRVHRIVVNESGAITLPLDVPQLEKIIEQNDVALMILDPLVSALDNEINPNKDNELRRGLEPVVAMADRSGCVVVGLVHFGKSTGRDALSLVLGSRGFTAVARTVFACAKRPDADGYVMSQVKNNLGPKVEHQAYRTIGVEVETSDGTMSVGRAVLEEYIANGVEEILTASGDRDAPKRREAADLLVAYLKSRGGEAPAKDCLAVLSADGISRTTAHDARLSAKIKTRRSGFGGGSFWQLPDFNGPQWTEKP